MNKYLSRLVVTSIAFVIALGVVSLRRGIEHAWEWKQSNVQIYGQIYTEAPIASASLLEEFDKLRTLSPYDIEVFINAHPQASLTKLWQRLGINGLNLDWQTEETSYRFFANCNACNAESFEYNLDDESDSEVLLRIADQLSESCRYLVFKPPAKSGDWKLIGHIDHDFGRYRMPQHMIVLSEGKSWLLVKEQGGSGSGVSLYFDRLFLVESGVLKEIMRFTSEGHQSGFSHEPEREFSGRILDCKMRNGIATIQIEFTVTYGSWDVSNVAQHAILFTKRQRAFFVRQLNRKMFTFDATQSDLSQNELDDVYNIDSLTNEGFLKYNFGELSRLAIGTDANTKEWLKRFLNVCESSEQKRRLRALLASS